MAVSVASHATAYSGSGTSLVIDKPTGLLEGELMLSAIRHNNVDGMTNPSDWTTFTTTFNPFNNVRLCYKYATAGDVSASNFTWTLGSSAISAGGILRITGVSPLIGSAVLAGGQSNTATPSISTGVTPTRANSLIVQFWFYQENSNDSLGGYAIATSNPTWTEQYDVAMEADAGMTCAWAVRPQTTSTGAWSCTGGTGTSDYNSFLVSINEQFIVDVTESITLTESYLNNVGILVEDSIILTEDIEANKQRMYTNTDKSSTTWINQNK